MDVDLGVDFLLSVFCIILEYKHIEHPLLRVCLVIYRTKVRIRLNLNYLCHKHVSISTLIFLKTVLAK
jgi:hypothetical protein